MAKVLNPLLSMGASGSVGGVTYGPFKDGWRANLKCNPTRRLTSGLPEVRSTMAYLTRLYGELSTAKQESWTQWGQDHPKVNSLGASYNPTGMNAFVSLNMVGMLIGGETAYSDVPPTENLQYSVTGLTVSTGAVNPGDIDLTWTVLGSGDAADFCEIKVGRGHASNAIQDTPSQLKRWGNVAGNIELETVDSLVEGLNYWIAVRYVGADGQTSPWVIGQGTPKLTV